MLTTVVSDMPGSEVIQREFFFFDADPVPDDRNSLDFLSRSGPTSYLMI